jgi:hypothetical protein
MSYSSGAVTTIAANSVGSSQITDGTVANADLANMASPSIKGRGTAATGVPEDLTPTGLFFGNGTMLAASNMAKQVYGITSMNFDPGLTVATTTVAAATVYLMKVPLPGSGTTVYSITNVHNVLVTKATSTLTHSFMGLLTSAGTLVGMSADLSSGSNRWDTSGTSPAFQTIPLASGPFNVTPTGIDDFVYVCYYVGTTAGTAPKFLTSAGVGAVSAAMNLGLSAATSRAATQSVADTSTPFAGLSMASNAASVSLIWAGVS